MKKLILILGGGLLAALAVLLYSSREAPIQSTPYPYLLTASAPEDLAKAEDAQILMIGDKSAYGLDRFMPELIQNLSKNLKSPLKYHFWAGKGEGLHRTLSRLKLLKKWPKIIIFLGASEEGLEDKFTLSEYSKIMLNFKIHNNPKFATLIMALPISSRFIYSNPKHVHLGDEIKKKEEVTFQNGSEELNYLKMSYKLFESELREINILAREHESTVLFLTSPINLEIAPKKVCSDMITATTMAEEVKITELFEKGDYKSAFNLLAPLVETIPGHAQMQFFFAKAALESGQLARAKAAFYKAAAFDCQLWRSHPVLNQLVRNLAAEFGQPMVDFDQLVNGQLGKDAIFLNDTDPQDNYYKLVIKILTERLKKLLNL